MTYLTTENSTQDGNPVLLFAFAGSNVANFTNAIVAISSNGVTYEPTTIKMGKVSQKVEQAKNPLTLEFPRGHSFAEPYLSTQGEVATTLTVYRTHASEPDLFVTYWKGRVAGSSASGHIITVSCESIFTSLRRAGLRMRYQKTCPHALYGASCGVDKTTYAINGTVGTVSKNIITTAAAATKPDGYFMAGMISISGTLRYVIKHEGNQLTLIKAFGVTPTIGEGVILYPGCSHSVTECGDKFNNVLNFGGFPWLPQVNPFSFKSLV